MLSGQSQERTFDVTFWYGAILCSESLRNTILVEKINLVEEAIKKENHEENFITQNNKQILKGDINNPGQEFSDSTIKNVPASELIKLHASFSKKYQALLNRNAFDLKAGWTQPMLWGSHIVFVRFLKIQVKDTTDNAPTQVFKNFNDFKAFIENGCKPLPERKDSGIEVVSVSKPRNCSVM